MAGGCLYRPAPRPNSLRAPQGPEPAPAPAPRHGLCREPLRRVSVAPPGGTPMDGQRHTPDVLGLALVVAALAFGVHILASHAGLTVARPAAFLQAALWGVVTGLVLWHWWLHAR